VSEGKIIEFRLPPPEPTMSQLRNETAIHCLEELLAQAKRGEVLSIAASYERPDGTVSCFWSSPDDRPRLGFAIAMLHHRFMADSVGGAEETETIPV